MKWQEFVMMIVTQFVCCGEGAGCVPLLTFTTDDDEKLE